MYRQFKPNVSCFQGSLRDQSGYEGQAVDVFMGNYADEKDTAAAIKRVYETDGYIIDTHTAVASAVYQKYFMERPGTGQRR